MLYIIGTVLIGIMAIICVAYGLLASYFVWPAKEVTQSLGTLFCIIFFFLNARLNTSKNDGGGRLWPEVLGVFSNIFKLLSKKNHDKEFVLDLWRLAKKHGVCPEDMECDEDLEKLGLAKKVEVLNNKLVFYRGKGVEETWDSYA